MAHDAAGNGYSNHFFTAGSATGVLMPATAIDGNGQADELYTLHQLSSFAAPKAAQQQLPIISGIDAQWAAAAAAASGGSHIEDLALRCNHGLSLSSPLCKPDSFHSDLDLFPSSRRAPVPSPGPSGHQAAGTGWLLDHHLPLPQPAAATSSSWQVLGSRYLIPAQELLQEFCSVPADAGAAAWKPKQVDHDTATSSSSAPAGTLHDAADMMERQKLKARLYSMLEEVDRRYRRYRDQMRALVSAFEAVAGDGAAATYTALASKAISRHFRKLKDRIVDQIRAAGRALGESDAAAPAAPGFRGTSSKGETPRLKVIDQCLRRQKLMQQVGALESHPWRPQRGLPERSVSILRAWLFEHFLHPYPSDVDKHILSRQTGLSRSQVSNWFINARVRLWKPMVEDMYTQEMKDQQQGVVIDSQDQPHHVQNPNPRSDSAGQDHIDQKPRQVHLLHEPGSLADIVSNSHQHRNMNSSMVAGFGAGPYGELGSGFGSGGVSLTLGLQQQQGGGFLPAPLVFPEDQGQMAEEDGSGGEAEEGPAGSLQVHRHYRNLMGAAGSSSAVW